MVLEENRNPEDTQNATKGTSDFVLWNVFFWKLIRSLAVIGAGTTIIYLVCKWLVY